MAEPSALWDHTRARRIDQAEQSSKGVVVRLATVIETRTNSAAEDQLLDAVITRQMISTVFQPVVDLVGGSVVGYEALSRGPADSPLHMPDQLFAAARRLGRHSELDLICRNSAISAAQRFGLTTPYTLFVNTEPDTVAGLPLTGDLSGLPIVLELTERELLARPADVLRTVEAARRLGWFVALDDVGANPASLAMLSIVNPEVIKLDLRYVQHRPDRETAILASVVRAQADRSGAALVAEGIESKDQLELAVSLGATLGQGYFFGRPKPLPALIPAPRPPDSPVKLPHLRASTPAAIPYEWLSGRRPIAADKHLLYELSRYLEEKALHGGPSTILLSNFQDHSFLTPDTVTRYGKLAEVCAMVAMIGVGMETEPLPGVRGGPVPPGHPLAQEWHVVVLTPDYSAALFARSRTPGSDDMEYQLVQDREIVCVAARSLLQYVVAQPS